MLSIGRVKDVMALTVLLSPDLANPTKYTWPAIALLGKTTSASKANFKSLITAESVINQFYAESEFLWQPTYFLLIARDSPFVCCEVGGCGHWELCVVVSPHLPK